LGEVAASGLEQDVDSAIQVLLDSGVSTPALRIAVARAGKLEQAGYWSLSMVAVGWICWVFVILYVFADRAEGHWHFMERGYCHPSHKARICTDASSELECARVARHCMPIFSSPEVFWSLFGLLEAAGWLLLFVTSGQDKRGLAAAALERILGVGGILLFFPPIFFRQMEPYDNIVGMGMFHLGLAPATLIISAMGPGWTSRVPVVGPRIVRYLMFRISCGRPRLEKEEIAATASAVEAPSGQGVVNPDEKLAAV